MLSYRVFIFFCLLSFVRLASGQTTVLPYEPGEGLRLSNPNRYSIRLSGMIQPMVDIRSYPTADAEDLYTRFRMRRAIAKLSGNADKENITYQIQVDLTGSSDGGGDATTGNYLMDAWISWKPNKQFEITVGQDNSQSDSRELVTLSSALQLAERSPVALAFASIREFGVFVNTSFKVGQNAVIQPNVSVTNGDGANVLTQDHGGLKYGGRLDFLPFGTFTNAGQYRQPDIERELTPKLVIGAIYSLNKGISDRRGRQSGTILYLDTMGQESLPDYQKIGFDFLFKYKGVSIFGEYVKATATVPSDIRQRVRNDGSTTTSFLVDNVQSIDRYVKGRMIIGSGLSLQGGYLFRNGFSFDARVANLKPERDSFLRNGQFNNRSNFYTFCISKYLGRNYAAKIQAMATVAKAQAGSLTVEGKPLKGNEVTGIIMFTFSL